MASPGADDAAAVTVVIPVWDAPYVAALPAALWSVRSQELEPRLVVVDNQSDTPLPDLPGATVVRTPRRLSSGAVRNLGLEQVRTPFVLFLDADDELSPGAVGAMSSALSARPRAVAQVMSIVDGGTGRRHRPWRIVFPLARFRCLFALGTALWSLYPTQGCALLRTDSVRDAGGYGEADHGEDWALAASLAFRGRVHMDRRPGAIYHRRLDSVLGEGLPTTDLLAAARLVRARLRDDPDVPTWGRALVPAIAAMQVFLIRVARPLYRGLRARFGGKGR